MVTHDSHAAATASRSLFLDDGSIVRDEGALSAPEIVAIMGELSA